MVNRVSFVVIPIDDFTNKVILDKSINMFVSGLNVKPIKKQDGFFVFTNIDEMNIDLTINSYSYNTSKLTIDTIELNHLNPIIKVRLKPNDKYNFPNNTTCIRGKGKPNTTIVIIQNNKNNIFKLFDDSIKESLILKIYNPLNIDLVEKSFIISVKGSIPREKFNIIEFNEITQEYILDRHLKEDYKKEICEISIIDYIDISEDGIFFLPLKNVTKEQNEVVIETQEGIQKIIKLIEGNINNVEILD